MFKALLSAASIFVLLFVTVFFPGFASARRCGERMPVTLLQLYRQSDAIFVATFDKSEDGEATEDNSNYTEVPVKKYYAVSSALKGETQKFVVLESSEYRFKSDAPVLQTTKPEGESAVSADSESTVETPAAAESAEDTDEADVEVEEGAAEDSEDETEIRPGDTVLLFLAKDEESGKLDLTEYVDGLKKMTPDALGAYDVRIRELNGLFAKEKPSYTDLVAWMVRCAEKPETRWEGTYELYRSFMSLDYEQDREKTGETEQSSTPTEEGDDSEESKEFETGDVNFAKALTETQKLILTNLLLELKGPKVTAGGSSSEDGQFPRGDAELIELVRRWGDVKVAVHLLAQLRATRSDPSVTSNLMASIASILNDEEIADIQARFSRTVWEDAEAEVEDENADDPEASPSTDESTAAPSATDAGEQQAEAPTGSEPVQVPDEEFGDGSEPPTAPANKKTYAELRDELVEAFIARAEKVIAGETKGDQENDSLSN